MHRRLTYLGIAYVAVVGALLASHRRLTLTPPHATNPLPAGTPGEWFARIRPFCNPVEVGLVQGREPAPGGVEGAGYAAACFALAGKVDRARELINQLAVAERFRAAGVVFEVAHPVADAGDDRAAGPIMEMVIEYWPNHYMALYHAGMSEYALGEPELARKNLTAFLGLYHDDDGWRRNAMEILQRLGGTEAVERASP
jgi:tetratricopeptide (TPR) repeat protein